MNEAGEVALCECWYNWFRIRGHFLLMLSASFELVHNLDHIRDSGLIGSLRRRLQPPSPLNRSDNVLRYIAFIHVLLVTTTCSSVRVIRILVINFRCNHVTR